MSLVERLRAAITKKSVEENYRILRLVGGISRYHILCLLHEHQPGLAVNQLSLVMQKSNSVVSHQLKILRKHGIVSCRRSGQEVIYRLSSGRIALLLQ